MDNDNNKRFNFEHLKVSQKDIFTKILIVMIQMNENALNREFYQIAQGINQQKVNDDLEQKYLIILLQQQKDFRSNILIQDQLKKPKNLSPLGNRILSDHGMSILDDVQDPNSTINDSIFGLLQQPEKKKETQILKKALRKPILHSAILFWSF